MDQTTQYGQMNFDLPHDVVKLPSEGKFYKNGKKSVKVGYLTAKDENLIMNANQNDNLIKTLLREKIYEPDVNIDELLDVDIQAILIFLRNSSFGPEYTFKVKDPATNKFFESSVLLDRVSVLDPEITPNEEGLFEINLTKSNKKVYCRILSSKDLQEINNIIEKYPDGVIAPVSTTRLERMIVKIEGVDESKKSEFINNLPIMDSKHIKKLMAKAEPRLDLKRNVKAPSGENVEINISFGVEFFRPFF